METIADVLAAQAAAFPDQPFLTEGEWTASFAEFFALTRRMAGFLAARGGRDARVLPSPARTLSGQII